VVNGVVTWLEKLSSGYVVHRPGFIHAIPEQIPVHSGFILDAHTLVAATGPGFCLNTGKLVDCVGDRQYLPNGEQTDVFRTSGSFVTIDEDKNTVRTSNGQLFY
jgi:hypothetical protein